MLRTLPVLALSLALAGCAAPDSGRGEAQHSGTSGADARRTFAFRGLDLHGLLPPPPEYQPGRDEWFVYQGAPNEEFRKHWEALEAHLTPYVRLVEDFADDARAAIAEAGGHVDSLEVAWVAGRTLMVEGDARALDAAEAFVTERRAAADSWRANPHLDVLTWNIWHGGREDGEDIGPQRVVDVIRANGADVVAMQETYGSGERIADVLGFHFHPRGTNVSILSRYPVLADLSVHEPFQCVGALLALPDASRVAVFAVWLPYSGEIWAEGTRDTDDPDAMLAACEASRAELEQLLVALEQRLADERLEGVPVVLAGDFNAMSHLDYGEAAIDQYGVALRWPTSELMARAGFRDAYRELHPVVDRAADATWTPRFPEQEQDRIDFVHYRSRPDPARVARAATERRAFALENTLGPWRAVSARVIREHVVDGVERFPSDHAAVLARLERRPHSTTEVGTLRAATYNVRHGEGSDGVLDLVRTADVLRELEADFVGLQEVDLGVARTNGVNQPLALADALGMHPAFGSFMDYQGGRYGMAILSKHPLVDTYALRLPDGNEPRVALIAEARLPDDSTVLVVNVHFDWVDDDGFRFAQARALAEHLAELDRPFVLLGDFNDGPDSRTLALFRELATEADKPDAARSTWPADEPRVEIDFVFAGPPAAWNVGPARVVDESVASDHRPVVAELVRR
ncbi:hypothetical protein Pla163_02630 [Planctomycetes bacterium Pla163]|uniref:Endonuclease/exonuclease/phosphatase domain-containing protein n=1 Tax=Rohdeia mirabilis TaxID=2528008 RepID=A0A518CVC3_9BACT|nr:hypothetical protein Pla163_02630 [Planctomycetes bacterium Pla163]